MSGDLRQALRLVSSLTNPSRMQAARWGAARVDRSKALPLDLRMPNPSAMRPEKVPAGQGASWRGRTQAKCKHEPWRGI